jgi:Ni/Co efflux regulator RcnB
MKKSLLALVFIAQVATLSIAKESAEETKQDVARHRAMAAAHTAAAQCRESGKDEDLCNKELQATCKGLAIGKFCGMKHAH